MKTIFVLTLTLTYLSLVNTQNSFASTKFELNPDLPIEDLVVAGLNKDEKPIIVEKNENEAKEAIDQQKLNEIIETTISTTPVPLILPVTTEQLTTTITIEVISTTETIQTSTSLPVNTQAFVLPQPQQIQNQVQPHASNLLPPQAIHAQPAPFLPQHPYPLQPLAQLPNLLTLSQIHEQQQTINKNNIEKPERWFNENYNLTGNLL